jgi:hypothetical protein
VTRRQGPRAGVMCAAGVSSARCRLT